MGVVTHLFPGCLSYIFSVPLWALTLLAQQQSLLPPCLSTDSYTHQTLQLSLDSICVIPFVSDPDTNMLAGRGTRDPAGVGCPSYGAV